MMKIKKFETYCFLMLDPNLAALVIGRSYHYNFFETFYKIKTLSKNYFM